jgi:hypothetical protein
MNTDVHLEHVCTIKNKFVSYREQFVSYINSDYLRLYVGIIIESLVENTEIHCVGGRQKFLMLQKMVYKYNSEPEE